MKRILSLLLGLSLAVTLIGVGVNAALTMPNVTQQIAVNGVGITVASSTPGIVILGDGTIQCPSVNINETATPNGTDPVGCQFTISGTGIAPSSVSVAAHANMAAGDGFSDGATFSGGVAPMWFSLSTSTNPVASVAGTLLPFAVQTHVSWGTAARGGTGTTLSDADIGKVILVTFEISATA